MSRQRKIDGTDVIVGYDFRTKQYYVINQNTTTYRSTAKVKVGNRIVTKTGQELIKEVLDIVTENQNPYTAQQLKELLEDTDEVRQNLYYTLSDTGSYISSIQINDYYDNPLVLKAEKHALYIKNTELNFNLKLNESKDTRVDILVKYFMDNFGINLTKEEVNNMYSMLVNNTAFPSETIKPCYVPSIYNVIEDKSKQPVTYSNKFAVSDFNNKANVVYTCTDNPYNIINPTNSADIITVEPSYNKILFLNPTELMQALEQGDKILISGATTVENTYTYTADGEYTVSSIDLTKTPCELVVQEALSSSYVFPYPKLYLQLSAVTILSINREDSSIKLSDTIPALFETGAVIEVTDTQQEIEGTTVSCNGVYTVGSVDTDNNTLYVQEVIPTSYTYTSGTQGKVARNMYLGEVDKVAEDTGETGYTVISLLEISPAHLSIAQTIFAELKDSTRTYYSITGFGTAQDTIKGTVTSYTGTEPLTEYTPKYPHIQINVPDTSVLIQVTKSDETGLMPTGNFIVNTPTECNQYLALYSKTLIPDNEVYSNINAEVGKDIVVPLEPPREHEIPTEYLTYKFAGLYSKYYTDTEADESA